MRAITTVRLALAAAGACLWLGACADRAAERRQEDLEAQIIQCEAARWAGPDRLLPRLLANPRQPAGVRARAALAMGRIGEPEFVPVLLAGLGDPSADLRAGTLFALGEILDAENASLHGYQPAEPVIGPIRRRLLEDPSALVRARAVEALGKTGERRWLGDLPRLAPDPARLAGEPTWQLYAEEWAKAALRTRHPGCGPGLAALLNTPVRVTAAKVLARLAGQKALKPEVPAGLLAGLRRDADPEVRAAAVRLGSVLDPPVPDSEILAMLEDPDDGVRVNVLQALGRSRSEAAVRALVAYVDRGLPAAETGADAFLQKELPVAVAALGPVDTVYAREAMARWLKGSALLAPHCLQAMVAAHPDAPLPPLAEVPPLRTRARVMRWIQAVAASKHPGAAAFLRGLESGPPPAGWHSEWIRAARPFYIPALLEAAAPGAGPGLSEFLSDKDPYVRAAALDWLQQRPAPPDAGALDEVCAATERFPKPDAPDPLVSAVPLLAKAGPRGQALLERLRGADFFQVRLMAARALHDAGVPDAWRSVAPMPVSDPSLYRNIVQRWRYPCLVQMDTSRGPVSIHLFRRDAPLTCANFLRLAGEHFYDGIAFHRVVPDFVAQGGCPLGSGNGGPGYAIPCEVNELDYTRGRVGMALSGKDSGGSQFFFTLSRQPHLDGGYTIFAEVVGGMDVVDRLTEEDTIQSIRVFWDIPWEERDVHHY